MTPLHPRLLGRVRRSFLAAVALATATVGGCFQGLDALDPFPCANDGSCPETFVCVTTVGCVRANECDVRLQNCGDGSASKCTFVLDGAETVTSVCLAPTGSKGRGKACSRLERGLDDCDAGLFCNATTSPDGQAACRSFCERTSDCSGGSVCAHLFGDRPEGLCVPGCSPGDGTCDAQHTCLRAAANVDEFACSSDGTVPAWGFCDGAAICGHGLGCFGSGAQGVCLQICGGAAACGAGQTCVTGGDVYGVCECNVLEGCGGGASCKPYGTQADGVSGYCVFDGPGTLGVPCNSPADCGKDMTCWGDDDAGYYCTQLCDAENTNCSSGTCLPLLGLANGGGVCN